jgi:hypothetical protein
MKQWLKENNGATIGWWIALIGCALIAFWLTSGSAYHHLGIGILTASLSLLVAMALFEALWWVVVELLYPDGHSTAHNPEQK